MSQPRWAVKILDSNGKTYYPTARYRSRVEAEAVALCLIKPYQAPRVYLARELEDE